jgi:hypothetical protein
VALCGGDGSPLEESDRKINMGLHGVDGVQI